MIKSKLFILFGLIFCSVLVWGGTYPHQCVEATFGSGRLGVAHFSPTWPFPGTDYTDRYLYAYGATYYIYEKTGIKINPPGVTASCFRYNDAYYEPTFGCTVGSGSYFYPVSKAWVFPASDNSNLSVGDLTFDFGNNGSRCPGDSCISHVCDLPNNEDNFVVGYSGEYWTKEIPYYSGVQRLYVTNEIDDGYPFYSNQHATSVDFVTLRDQAEYQNLVQVNADGTESPLTELFAGQTKKVRLRIKNNGNTFWLADSTLGYGVYNLILRGTKGFSISGDLDTADHNASRLAIQRTTYETTYRSSDWSPGHYVYNSATFPGATETFEFNLTAPSTPGNYSINAYLERYGIGSFNHSKTYTLNVKQNVTNSSCSIEIRGEDAEAGQVFRFMNGFTKLTPGNRYTFCALVHNVGTTNWSTSDNYQLGSVNGNTYSSFFDSFSNRFTPSLVLAPDASQSVCQSHILVKNDAYGSLSLSFRTVKSDGSFFGQSCELAVPVGLDLNGSVSMKIFTVGSNRVEVPIGTNLYVNQTYELDLDAYNFSDAWPATNLTIQRGLWNPALSSNGGYISIAKREDVPTPLDSLLEIPMVNRFPLMNPSTLVPEGSNSQLQTSRSALPIYFRPVRTGSGTLMVQMIEDWLNSTNSTPSRNGWFGLTASRDFTVVETPDSVPSCLISSPGSVVQNQPYTYGVSFSGFTSTPSVLEAKCANNSASIKSVLSNDGKSFTVECPASNTLGSSNIVSTLRLGSERASCNDTLNVIPDQAICSGLATIPSGSTPINSTVRASFSFSHYYETIPVTSAETITQFGLSCGSATVSPKNASCQLSPVDNHAGTCQFDCVFDVEGSYSITSLVENMGQSTPSSCLVSTTVTSGGPSNPILSNVYQLRFVSGLSDSFLDTGTFTLNAVLSNESSEDQTPKIHVEWLHDSTIIGSSDITLPALNAHRLMNVSIPVTTLDGKPFGKNSLAVKITVLPGSVSGVTETLLADNVISKHFTLIPNRSNAVPDIHPLLVILVASLVVTILFFSTAKSKN